MTALLFHRTVTAVTVVLSLTLTGAVLDAVTISQSGEPDIYTTVPVSYGG